jgi:hypothetical protein
LHAKLFRVQCSLGEIVRTQVAEAGMGDQGDRLPAG